MSIRISDCRKELESIVESVDSLLEHLGYDHARFSKLNSINTTEYDAIVFRNSDGVEFRIGFDVSVDWLNDKSSNYLDKNNDRVDIIRC